jgi:hypothetical protein
MPYGTYIEAVGCNFPSHLNGFTHGATGPVGFFFYGWASAFSGAPVTRQTRQSGRISAPMDL